MDKSLGAVTDFQNTETDLGQRQSGNIHDRGGYKECGKRVRARTNMPEGRMVQLSPIKMRMRKKRRHHLLKARITRWKKRNLLKSVR
jgi:hypothetical protein